LIISLLNHGDRVASASLAQLVNVIAPIMTETGGRSWKQTTFHPFAQASRFAGGDILRLHIAAPATSTAKYGDVPSVDAAATRDADSGDVAVFAVNRSLTEPTWLTIDTRSLGEVTLVEATQLSNPNPYLVVSAETADSVGPIANARVVWEGTTLRVQLPATSWNMVRLARVRR
jgi:alpha-N-arabinofuranosidase